MDAFTGRMPVIQDGEDVIEMKCQDALKLIHEVLDGTASEDTQARLREHLEGCPACAAEYAQFDRWETLLRAPDPDEPGDAYFAGMARAIGSEVRKRERQPAPMLAPSWRLSWAMAAACLIVGLGAGHLALPKTVERTETVVKWVEVPGPVQEKVKEVKVPVEVVRREVRTVVKYVHAEPSGPAPASTAPTLVADHVTTAAPATPAVAEAEAPPTLGAPYHTGIPAMRLGYEVAYAVDTSRAGLSRSDMRLLASRLRTDMSTVDTVLSTSALAATLASDMNSAGAEMDRTLRVEGSVAPEGTH
jgi:anti-sigma factor RsiW